MKPNPTDNRPRVARGGSWYVATVSYIRAAYCYVVGTSSFRINNNGFRLTQIGCRQVLTVKP